jgi:hypothetical protein
VEGNEVLSLDYDAKLEKQRIDPQQIIPDSHEWKSNNLVLATSEDGNTVIQYSHLDGSCHILFESWMSNYEADKWRENHGNAGSVSNGERICKPEYGKPGSIEAILTLPDGQLMIGGRVSANIRSFMSDILVRTYPFSEIGRLPSLYRCRRNC